MTVDEHLRFAIAFALTKCKSEFRAMARSHNTDAARKAAAEKIAAHLERSNFTIEMGSPGVAPTARYAHKQQETDET